MEGQDIRGLIEAYSQVYETPEVLNEDAEILSERGFPGMTQANVDAVRARSAAENQSRARIDALRQQRFGSGGSPSARGSGGTRYGTSAPKPTFQNSGGFGRYGAPSTQVKTPTEKPAPTRPGSNTPAPARPTSTQKPTVPTAPAKPAPSAQTGDKAKDMATWAKANPTLANKPKTPNPLMQKTFGYQTGNAPDQVAKASQGVSKETSDKAFAKSKEMVKSIKPSADLKMDLDIFDLVKGYLLDEGYAETEQNAIVMMANMSEEWRKSILEAHGVEKDEGGKHKEGKHPKGKEEKGEKVTEKEGNEKEDEKEMKG